MKKLFSIFAPATCALHLRRSGQDTIIAEVHIKGKPVDGVTVEAGKLINTIREEMNMPENQAEQAPRAMTAHLSGPHYETELNEDLCLYVPFSRVERFKFVSSDHNGLTLACVSPAPGGGGGWTRTEMVELRDALTDFLVATTED